MTNNSIDISNFVRVLIQTLNQYEYLVLRNYSTLKSHIDNDVDIIIANKNKKKFIRNLNARLSEFNWFLYNHAYFSCDSFFFYNQESLEVIHIDLFNSLNFKSIIYLSRYELYKNHRKINDMIVPALEHDISDKLFSNILFNDKIKDKYRSEIKEFLSDQNSNTFNDFPLLSILNSIKVKELETIESQIPMIKQSIIRKNLYRLDLSYFRNVLKKILFKPGTFIVVLGADGSGKSTIIDRLKVELEHYFSYKKMHYFHFCPTDRYNLSENSAPVSNPHSQKEYSTMTSIVKLVFLFVQFYKGYFKSIYSRKIKNHFVIGDRYFPDILMDPKRYRLKNWPMLFKILIKLLPKPDIYIGLTGNPELLQKRKNEVAVEEVNKYCTKLEQFLNLKKNSILVDTTVLNEVESIHYIKSKMLSILRSKAN